MQFGLIFSAATTCKKAYDALQTMKGVPEQAYYLWQLSATLEPPLKLCCTLMCHEDTHATVRPAVILTRAVLSEVDQLLGIGEYQQKQNCNSDDEDEDDDRPYGDESWEKWWKAVPTRAKETVSRQQMIPVLSTKLSQCLSAMQVAITTCQMGKIMKMMSSNCNGKRNKSSNNSPHLLLHDNDATDSIVSFFRSTSYQTSRTILHLFEMGKLDNAVRRQREKEYASLIAKGGGKKSDNNCVWAELVKKSWSDGMRYQLCLGRLWSATSSEGNSWRLLCPQVGIVLCRLDDDKDGGGERYVLEFRNLCVDMDDDDDDDGEEGGGEQKKKKLVIPKQQEQQDSNASALVGPIYSMVSDLKVAGESASRWRSHVNDGCSDAFISSSSTTTKSKKSTLLSMSAAGTVTVDLSSVSQVQRVIQNNHSSDDDNDGEEEDELKEQFSYVFKSNDDDTKDFKIDFVACAQPGEACYFPRDQEMYHFLSRETFEVLMSLVIEISSSSSVSESKKNKKVALVGVDAIPGIVGGVSAKQIEEKVWKKRIVSS